jgi:hypothetical protein
MEIQFILLSFEIKAMLKQLLLLSIKIMYMLVGFCLARAVFAPLPLGSLTLKTDAARPLSQITASQLLS